MSSAFPVGQSNTAQIQVYPTRVLFQPSNPEEARERNINNSLFAQMLEFAFQMGANSGGSNATTQQLIFENKELREHILQRTQALEKKWLGKAEYFSAKVDAIYFKFHQLHKDLTAENQEAKRIQALELNCVTPGTKEWDYRVHDLACGGNYSMWGKAGETASMYYTYASHMQSYMDTWEELHLKCRDQFKAAIQAEIQKIQTELLLEELSTDTPRESQQIAAFNVNDAAMIDIGVVFQAFTQLRQEETQTLDERNDAIRSKNECLIAKKTEIKSMKNRLLLVFHQQLDKKLTWLNEKIESANESLANKVKDYPTRLSELGYQPTSRRYGHYKTGLELEKKIRSELNEIAALAVALQKEITP